MLLSLLMLAATACSNTSTKVESSDSSANDTGKIIRVGFVYPKTGTYASFGEYTEEFTNYAILAANEAGITIDGESANISLITADSQSDPKEAKRAAENLIDNKNVDIMITSKTADTTVPVSKVCEKKGVVCLSVDTPDEAWAVDTHKYSFHAGFDTESELASFKSAWDQTESNLRVGVLHANDTEGSIFKNSFTSFAEKNGYTAYDPGAYQPGQTDFTNIIRNLKTQKVQVLAGVMSSREFKFFYDQLKLDGYITEIKAITVAKAALFEPDIEYIDVNGLCTEVWWNPDFPTVSSINGFTSSKIAEQFEAITGQSTIPVTAGYDYANIEILYAVLNNAGSLETSALLDAAKNLDLDTVIGKIKYNSENYSSQPLATGQWVYDDINKKWSQEIIGADQIEGLETTNTLAPLLLKL